MITIPQYTRQDRKILLGVLTPGIVVLNLLIFGTRYLQEWKVFLFATPFTFAIMSVSWIMHTWVAVTLRNRFTAENDSPKRIVIAIVLFLTMTGVTISVLFWGYNAIRFMDYEINESRYEWALLGGAVANIFITFVHEGVWSFEKWKTTLKETEELKREYMQSQLLGLRSQVNPHFLFNSLNSLSSLIQENREEAEHFLDEMSKVYRYLLRNSDEQLVTLESELQFIQSYFYMLKVRYCGAVAFSVDVDPQVKIKYLPPLTLQILIESAFNMNMVSKELPLNFKIYTDDKGWLKIQNNLQRKIGDKADNMGIENIKNKFRLLCQQRIVIHDIDNIRTIELPLISSQETLTA